MNGRVKAGIQWAAVVGAAALLWTVATYTGCVPVTSSEFNAHVKEEIGFDSMLDQRIQHVHEDVEMLMQKEGLPHTHSLPPSPHGGP